MDNILNFPSTTIVNKPVPKNAFYGRSSDSSLREFLTREFEGIVWLYKLAPATLNVEDGEYVHEIDVFYCRMKEDKYSISLSVQWMSCCHDIRFSLLSTVRRLIY